MDISEAAIDNIITLFDSTKDDSNFLTNPICNFSHFFIDYLIKTGWNGWLMVTKYLAGIIRKSILNEVIDYCKYLDCVSKSDVDSACAGENLKSVPLWFNKLHDDTIYYLLMEVNSFCHKGLTKGIDLCFESKMTSNALFILATRRSGHDLSSTLIEYESVETFPKFLSDHQSILDILLSSYVAYQDNTKQGFKHSKRTYSEINVMRRFRVQCFQQCIVYGRKPCPDLKLVDSSGKEGEVKEDGGGGNQEAENCLDILGRCAEESKKAMLLEIKEMITSFGEPSIIDCYYYYPLRGKGEKIGTCEIGEEEEVDR